MAKEQLQFVEIDPASLSEEQQAKWAALLAAKAEFKASLQAMAPQGSSVQFSDKYGKLKLAITKAASKPVPAAQSLADFIAAQQATGRRV
jgi:hypothetical protein